MPKEKINIVNIRKSYGNKVVFDNLSMSFSLHEISGIMAPSGAGKTTLLRIITGLEKPDSGEISIVNEKGECVPLGSNKIAMVFQEDRLIEHLDGVENVLIIAGVRGQNEGANQDANYKPGFSKEEIIEAFDRLAIPKSEAIGKPVSEYSGGMKRRVALLRALFSGKEIILMDEPFKGLDEETKKSTIDFIKDFSAKEHPTLIVVTHDIEELYLLGSGNENIYNI